MRKITLTDKHQELLFQIPLFRDLPLNIKHSLLDRLDISLYSVDKKDIIATQGTLCKKLYVLLEGKLRVDIIDGLGNEVMIEYIVAARAFATPHLFSSDGVLPATFTAMEDSTLLTASKESMFKLISEEPKILHNFLCITGNCNVCKPYHEKLCVNVSLSTCWNTRKRILQRSTSFTIRQPLPNI